MTFTLKLRVETDEGLVLNFLQVLPISALPSNRFERGVILMGFWRQGMIGLRDAWELF